MVRKGARDVAVLQDASDYVEALLVGVSSSFDHNGLTPVPTKVKEAVQSCAELRVTAQRAQGMKESLFSLPVRLRKTRYCCVGNLLFCYSTRTILSFSNLELEKQLSLLLYVVGLFRVQYVCCSPFRYVFGSGLGLGGAEETE